MDGLIAYILAKKIALGAVSGISNISISGNQLIFQFKDGTSTSMLIPLPEDGKNGKDGADGNDGVSVINVAINEEGHLICLLSSGMVLDAGKIPSFNPIIFVDNMESLPEEGESSILYITNTSIYIWNGIEYVKLSSNSTTSTLQWENF